MIVWTWQKPHLKPFVDPKTVDPRSADSYYGTNPSFQPHYERLWRELESDRLLWCFVDEAESQKTWKGRERWRLEIPEPILQQAGYASTIDPPVWEKILGIQSWPDAFEPLEFKWQRERLDQGLTSEVVENRKTRDYHDLKSPSDDWWNEVYLESPEHRGWSQAWLEEQLGEHADSPPDVLLKRSLPEPWCHRDPV